MELIQIPEQTQQPIPPMLEMLQAEEIGVEVCEYCGNVYRVSLLKEGDDWNDFGQRYCPFCGM